MESSLDLHVPNVSLERLHAPPVVYNDRALTEFIQGEERCLKFVNQDLTFLQESHIPLTFTNVSHTPTPLKESLCIISLHVSQKKITIQHAPTLCNPPLDLHQQRSTEHKMNQP